MGIERSKGRSGIIAAALWLAACASEPARTPERRDPSPSAAAAPVVFDVSADPPDATRGDLARVRVRIANRSADRVLVLSSLRLEPAPPPGAPAPPPSTLSFQTSRRGALAFDRDRYRLTPSTDRTQPVFNTGVLFPRESLNFAMPVRVLGERVSVRLEYDLLPFDRAAALLYFPADRGEFRRREDFGSLNDGARSGTLDDRLRAIRGGDVDKAMSAALDLVRWPIDDAALKAKLDALPESAWYYKQLVLSERKAMRAVGETADERRRQAPVVLFIRSLAMDPPARSDAAAAFRVRDGNFPLSDALTRVPPGKIEAVSGFSLHGSWMIRTDGVSRLVSPAGVTDIPDVDPAVFDAIDAIQENVVEVDFEKGAHLAVAGTYEIVRSQEDDGRTRSAAFVPRSDFVAFLRRMREYGGAWRVELTYRSGRAVPVVTY